jgi:glycosyltransferase involved in cell wall biosynthesis
MSGIFVHEQVKELKKLGNDITVFAPVPYTFGILKFFSERYRALSEIPSREEIDGVEIYHSRYLAVPGGYFKAYWGYIYYSSMLSKVTELHTKNPFDLIHAHGSAPDDFGAYLLSEKLDLPYVLTIHGDAVYKLVKHGGRFRNTKKSVLHADAVVGVSSKVVDRVRTFTGREKSLYTVLNGFIPGEQETNSNDSNEVKILFAATLIERKGCKYLIDAFKKLTARFENISLTVAGGGPLLNEMKKRAENLNISDHIIFTGVVAHSDMLKYMASCDIFIMPSWDEAFGVVYLEAMSQKKPVIGTEDEGITDVVIDGVNGLLVKPRDVDSIVGKLGMLIEDEALRKTLGEKGFESARELTWESNARQMNDIYEKVSEKSLLKS